METPAEIQLISTIASYLHEHQPAERLMNLGAGTSVVLENKLVDAGCKFKCDRLDVDDCNVDHPNVGNCYQCSAEQMTPVGSAAYDLVFSNYVLEHIEDLGAASQEIARILKPQGLFIASIPNPTAPEFVIARITPLWFHRFIRGGTGWHTSYSFSSLRALSAVFSDAGMETTSVTHYPTLAQYFERFGPLRWLASGYDGLVRLIGWKRLMGNVCFIARKRS